MLFYIFRLYQHIDEETFYYKSNINAIILFTNYILDLFLHFRDKFKSHFFQVGVLGHNGDSGRIRHVVVECKINARWRRPYEVATVLW